MNDERPRGQELRSLKSRGQLLKPVVSVGKGGLSEALVASVEQALADHELIKVRFEMFKDQKKQLAPELAARTGSHLVQRVGNVAVLYRRRPARTAKCPQLAPFHAPAHDECHSSGARRAVRVACSRAAAAGAPPG